MDERKDFLGRGWAWPLRIEPRSGGLALSAFEDDVREALRLLIDTSPGERLMRPAFGCGIHDLAYAPIDGATRQRIRSLVQEAITRFEARVEVVDITVDVDQAADGLLLIELDYRIRSTNQSGNLVYPFQFREGGRSG